MWQVLYCARTMMLKCIYYIIVNCSSLAEKGIGAILLFLCVVECAIGWVWQVLCCASTILCQDYDANVNLKYCEMQFFSSN